MWGIHREGLIHSGSKSGCLETRWGPSRIHHHSLLGHAFGWSERSEKMLPIIQQSQPSPSYTPGAAAPWAFNSRAGGRPQGKKWYHFTLDHPKKLHPRRPGKLAAPSLIPSPQGCSPWRGRCGSLFHPQYLSHEDPFGTRIPFPPGTRSLFPSELPLKTP